MAKYRKIGLLITTIFLAFLIFVFNYYTPPSPFYLEANILKLIPASNTASRLGGTAGDLTEEYHLWLKLDISKNRFEKLLSDKDTLVIKGFAGERETNFSGLPLLFTKNIIFSSDNSRELTDDEELAFPRISHKIDYQNQFYITIKDDVVTAYIHLEGNIKPHSLSRYISVSLIHFKEDRAITSKTLRMFKY